MNCRLTILSCILILLTIECSGIDQLKVENIYVNENTGDQVDSKSIAIINGANISLKKLIADLNGSQQDNLQYMKCIDDNYHAINLLKNYTINSERLTSHSYSAYIDFIFNKKDIESIMNKCGFDYASAAPGKTLLIPLIKVNSKYRIIDRELDVELFLAINQIPKHIGLLDIETIYNVDLFTIENLDLNILMNGTYKEIHSILNKYNSKTLLLIGIDSIANNKVLLNMRFISVNEEYKDTQEYLAEISENKTSLLKRAYKSLIQNMDLNWKKGFVGVGEKVYSSNVIIELNHPSEWKKLNNILRRIDSIKEYKFKTIDHNAVEVDMKYIISPDQLSRILKQNNVAVFKRDDKTIIKFLNK